MEDSKTMERKKQQVELIYKLGLLLSPLQDIVDHPDKHTHESRAYVAARYFADSERFTQEINSFMIGESGHRFEREWVATRRRLLGINRDVREHLDDPQTLSVYLEDKRNAIINNILAVPISIDASILEAHSPFSTYCVVKDLCQAVTQRLTWVDGYIDATLFYRYLRDVGNNVQVTLLTFPQTKRKQLDFVQLLDVSRLYAVERGPNNYRLITNEAIHDRWLCCDEQLYILGGSVKDASFRGSFTLTKLDPTVENYQRIDQLMQTGTEVFGITHPKHP